MNRSKYMGDELSWDATDNPFAPFHATVAGVTLEIQVTDDIDAPAYTLLVDGEPTDRFNGWPATWRRPDRAEVLRVSGTPLEQIEYAHQDLTWAATGSPSAPFDTVVDGVRLQVVAGDWPAENMYILLADDTEVARFDVMPSNWRITVPAGSST